MSNDYDILYSYCGMTYIRNSTQPIYQVTFTERCPPNEYYDHFPVGEIRVPIIPLTVARDVSLNLEHSGYKVKFTATAKTDK